MIKSNLLKLLFLTSFVQSDPFISDIQYFNEVSADDLTAVMDGIKRNIPIKDSWTKKSEYQELLNTYKDNTKSSYRTYKIKVPIQVGCSYYYTGACFDVENEVLVFKSIENYLSDKIYTKKKSPYSYKSDEEVYYSFKKFRGKNKVSIPRDFLKDKYEILTLNAYVKLDIKDLVFNSNPNIIEIIDLILSDEDDNIALSTNFSYLIDVNSKELNTISDTNDLLEPDYSEYIEDSLKLAVIDVGDITEIVTKSKKLKKARALTSSTAKKMSKVYEALEKLDDNNEPTANMVTAISILTELRNNQFNLSSYDRAVIWNAWAYVYFTQDKYDQAIQAYKYVIIEPDVTLPIRNSALYTLAQLNIVQENYIQGIELMLLWMDQVETITAESWSLLAQAYFQEDYYESAMDSINFAISLAKVEGYEPKQLWYILLAKCIRELQKEIGDEQAIKQLMNIGQLTLEDILKAGLDPNDITGVKIDDLDIMIKDTPLNFNFKKAEELPLRDGEYIPLFKVQPIYPRRAQERGTQGYAIVSFTITDSGSVKDVIVIEGYCGDPEDPQEEMRPCSIFNSASSRAALKLKYKPKIVNGKAVSIEGVIHRFTYLMAD